jgi:hypothetical protein
VATSPSTSITSAKRPSTTSSNVNNNAPQSRTSTNQPIGVALQLELQTLTVVRESCSSFLGFAANEGAFDRPLSLYTVVHEMDREKLVEFHRRLTDQSKDQPYKSALSIDLHLRNIHGIYNLYTLSIIPASEAFSSYGLRRIGGRIAVRLTEYQHPLIRPKIAAVTKRNDWLVSPVSPTGLSLPVSKVTVSNDSKTAVQISTTLINQN